MLVSTVIYDFVFDLDYLNLIDLSLAWIGHELSKLNYTSVSSAGESWTIFRAH